jgi:hypothetical protein
VQADVVERADVFDGRPVRAASTFADLSLIAEAEVADICVD